MPEDNTIYSKPPSFESLSPKEQALVSTLKIGETSNRHSVSTAPPVNAAKASEVSKKRGLLGIFGSVRRQIGKAVSSITGKSKESAEKTDHLVAKGLGKGKHEPVQAMHRTSPAGMIGGATDRASDTGAIITKMKNLNEQMDALSPRNDLKQSVKTKMAKDIRKELATLQKKQQQVETRYFSKSGDKVGPDWERMVEAKRMGSDLKVKVDILVLNAELRPIESRLREIEKEVTTLQQKLERGVLTGDRAKEFSKEVSNNLKAWGDMHSQLSKLEKGLKSVKVEAGQVNLGAAQIGGVRAQMTKAKENLVLLQMKSLEKAAPKAGVSSASGGELSAAEKFAKRNIGEIFDTEHSYSTGLNHATTEFFVVLPGQKEGTRKNCLGHLAEVTNDPAAKKILSDFEKAVKAHQKEVAILEKKLDKANTKMQNGDYDGAMNTLRDAYKSINEYAKTNGECVRQHEGLTKVLNDIMRDHPAEFNKINSSFQKLVAGGQDVSAVLIVPVQRMPRHQLLLRDLQKNGTKEGAEESAWIGGRLIDIETRLTALNESMRPPQPGAPIPG